MQSAECAVYSVQCTVYSVQCTVYSAQCAVYDVHITACTGFTGNNMRHISLKYILRMKISM